MTLNRAAASHSVSCLKQSKKLLFFSLEDWSSVWRRNQFLCAGLHAGHPDLEILWICPPTDIMHSIGTGDRLDFQSSKLTPVEGFSRIFQLKPIKPLFNIIGRGINNWWMRHQIERAVSALSWNDYSIWINDHRARRYLPSSFKGCLIYDITDDWTECSQSQRAKNAVVEDDQWLLENAHCVIVCSEELRRKKSLQSNRVRLIPNGVDYERYHPAKAKTYPVAEQMKMFNGPIAGYTGTLHSDRLDLELIAVVAKKLAHVHFVFIGPNSLSPTERGVLAELPNVHILGERPYTELPSYVQAFDVCITPHKVNPFTESLNPLKLYEYLSTGKPVVSTACAGFRELPELVCIADVGTFAGSVQACLEENDESKVEDRLHWASEQSWNKRVHDVEKCLQLT